MKVIFGLGALVFVGVTGWQLGERLSSDAIGMALGILFGVMAGIPASLMVLAARRRESTDEFYRPRRSRQPHPATPYGHFTHQPPVIVVTGQGTPVPQGGYSQPLGIGQPNGYSHDIPHHGQMLVDGPTAPPQREFRVVGEVEEILEPW